jgi:general secretion pathway protein K
MRSEVDAARNFKEEAEAAALAEAGIAQGVAELINAVAQGGPDPLAAFAKYRSEEVPLGRGRFQVSVTDEESKIHLNRTSEEVLARLLQNTGVEASLAAAIADAALDWRDPDDLNRMNGAETSHYRSLPQPYRARNGDFERLDELLLVKGMTSGIFHGTVRAERLEELLAADPEARDFRPGEYLGVERFLTIDGTGRVNLNTAGPDVLRAMGVPGQEVAALMDARAGGTIPRDVFPTARRAEFGRNSTTFTIESAGSLPGSPAVYRINAVVRSEGAGRVRMLRWTEGV